MEQPVASVFPVKRFRIRQVVRGPTPAPPPPLQRRTLLALATFLLCGKYHGRHDLRISHRSGYRRLTESSRIAFCGPISPVLRKRWASSSGRQPRLYSDESLANFSIDRRWRAHPNTESNPLSFVFHPAVLRDQPAIEFE